MTKAFIGVAVGIGVLLSTGCSGIGGHRGKHAAQYFGDLKILGHENDVTVRSGSEINFLKIAGDGNRVKIEDRVTLGKIEIWGENCVVEIPEQLIVRSDIVGVGSRIVRRPRTLPTPVVGPEGESIQRVPIEPGFEQPLTPQPSGGSPSGGQPAVVPAVSVPSEPVAAGPEPAHSSDSGVSVTPAGERVIPPAGVHPGGGL